MKTPDECIRDGGHTVVGTSQWRPAPWAPKEKEIRDTRCVDCGAVGGQMKNRGQEVEE